MLTVGFTATIMLDDKRQNALQSGTTQGCHSHHFYSSF